MTLWAYSMLYCLVVSVVLVFGVVGIRNVSYFPYKNASKIWGHAWRATWVNTMIHTHARPHTAGFVFVWADAWFRLLSPLLSGEPVDRRGPQPEAHRLWSLCQTQGTVSLGTSERPLLSGFKCLVKTLLFSLTFDTYINLYFYLHLNLLSYLFLIYLVLLF